MCRVTIYLAIEVSSVNTVINGDEVSLTLQTKFMAFMDSTGWEFCYGKMNKMFTWWNLFLQRWQFSYFGYGCETALCWSFDFNRRQALQFFWTANSTCALAAKS